MKILIIILNLIFLVPTINAQEEKYELAKINFEGNNSISEGELRQVIISRETPGWLSQFLNSISNFGKSPVYFDSSLIAADLNSIKDYYHSNGFFKVSVSYDYQISDGEIILNYYIRESEPAIIKELNLKGLESIPESFREMLFNRVAKDTGRVYKDDIIENNKNYVIGFLRDNGYMLASYEPPEILVDTVKDEVVANITFSPGDRYRISEVRTSITSVGEDNITDELLRQIVGIKPGEYYSNYQIQRGQVRLYRTDLFTSAIINSVISDTSNNYVPLVISADVGKLNELSPELIMNNEDNTFNMGLGLSFTKKNFLGDARKFTVSSSAAAQNFTELIKHPTFADSSIFGYFDTRIVIEQPFLFGKPINTKYETYFTTQKRKEEYNSFIYGAKLSFDFELPQYTYFNSLNAYLNIERAEYKYKDVYLINLLSLDYQRLNYSKEEADSLSEFYIYNALGGELVRTGTNALIGVSFGTNQTNDIFFPTEGYTLSLLLEEGNSIPYLISRTFGSSFDRPLFFKTSLTSTFFIPVYNSPGNSLGIKFKAGNIFNYYGDKAGISINQRFYSGGSNSIRGWSTRQLVPPQILLPFEKLNQLTFEDLEAILAKGAPSGGFFLLEGSLETRNRIIGDFGGVAFIDFGNTLNGAADFRFDRLAVAAGFGFRYYSEFAPLRIDFGFKIYDPYDKRNFFHKQLWNELLQFHIGIGEAF
ncbi:BamA/OMP85 family outer membrane protein [Melioribacter sp. OK-6-Me]|uniref:BamA/OMP85 family outer membrane protein n=1 Tax=unclassified Melioribacter TaxID=2627329 RepID=UPI003ED9B158